MKPHQNLIEAGDLPAALGFLTRAPIHVDGDWAAARGARVVWAYPLVGLGIGAMVAGIMLGLGALGVPTGMAAALALGLSIFVTGALHEDGLADTCDGLWGGWTKERRLAIMKDSRIGAYGVLGLGLMIILRWQGYAELSDTAWAIVAVPAASRAAMVPLMRLPNARGSGVSATVGRPPMGAVYLAVVLGALPLLVLGLAGIVVIVITAATALLIAKLSLVKIGGQTGDTLGATQQMTEVAALVTLATVL